jgi:hypothetical protein
MLPIKKQIVTDANNQPVAVQVSYADWLEIERILRQRQNGAAAPNVAKLAGSITLSEDPLQYQDRVRGEWR